MHIWWARRPLTASRATALAALLPDDPSRRLDKPPAAVVERLDVHYEPYRGEFSDFRIRFR